MDDEAAVPVQHAAHVVERAAEVQVRNVDVPMAVRGVGLVEALAFLRRFAVVPIEHASGCQHTVDARRAGRDDVRVEHHVGQSAVAFARMIEVELEDGLLFPILEPVVTRDPAVVFVHFAVTLLPTVERGLWHAYPVQNAFGGNLSPIPPAANVIDDRVPDVVGNPNSV